jgi:glutamate synthase domain-containing protein 1
VDKTVHSAFAVLWPKSYTSGRRLSTLFSKFLSAPDISVAFYHRVRRSKTAFVKTDKVVRGTLTFCIKFNMIKMNKDVRQGAGAPWRAFFVFPAAAPRGKALRGALNRRTAGRYGPPRGETGKGMVFMLKEGEVRIPSGCAISGVFHKDGRRENGSGIVAGIAAMHERSNGLGGGFAGYGIYPEYRELYAFHVFYDAVDAQHAAEARLLQDFDVESSGTLPTRPIAAIRDAPSLMRYFAAPKPQTLLDSKLDEREFVVRFVTRVNREIGGAYVFSCGKNMGVFKAVGYPEDVGEFYRLEEYEGYAWTAHGRYPTNTPGWWGGAHPFSILDYSVVHNGEISSYDANRRFIEMYGYNCSLLTDTEVITYIIDFLVRRKGLTLEEAAGVIAAPFWSTIEQMPEAQRERLAYLRETFASLLITGPFSILLGFTGGMMALNDRLKLRSMVCAEKGEAVYFASEECAIRVMEPDVETLWAPRGGQAVVVRLNDGVTV